MTERKNTTPPYKNGDPAETGVQFLENLATGYWYSQVLFTALELGIFSHLSEGHTSLAELSKAAGCRTEPLLRLMRVLERLHLVSRFENSWQNSLAAERYLVRTGSDYMGDFLLYRKFMQENWAKLTETVRGREAEPPAELDYRERTYRYVRATDSLVRRKLSEISEFFRTRRPHGRLLDVGGGAGSLSRGLRDRFQDDQAAEKGCSFELFELEDVIEAAKRLYPDPEAWQDITIMTGDFRSHQFSTRYNCIFLSNFLHAYSAEEARELLFKCLGLIEEGGCILIHDYFPDVSPAVGEKGALYDLCMMQNTYNGGCHDTAQVESWLQNHEKGRELPASIHPLQSDSALMLIGGASDWHVDTSVWQIAAKEIGFDNAVAVSPQDVVTAPWVEQKCRFGCPGYGKNYQCPPHSPSCAETEKILASYSTALLVQGQPPGKDFHERLLELERRTFLAGYHKALVYGAGPCSLCKTCMKDEVCLKPGQARPAMEACGIDVYETARRAGITLDVVTEKTGFVKYIGLLLVE